MEKNQSLLKVVSVLLDKLVKVEKLSGDSKETIYDEAAHEIKLLAKEDNLVQVIDEAVIKKPIRKKYVVYLLSEIIEVTGVLERMHKLLNDPDENIRSWVIQTIGQNKLEEFAPLLNECIKNDLSEFCRAQAIHAAAKIKSQINLPIILDLARENKREYRW